MQLIVFIALQIYSVHTNACVIGLDKLHVVFAGLEGQTGKVERHVVRALMLNWLLVQLIVFRAVLT